jgi:ribosomal protein S27AE
MKCPKCGDEIMAKKTGHHDNYHWYWSCKCGYEEKVGGKPEYPHNPVWAGGPTEIEKLKDGEKR